MKIFIAVLVLVILGGAYFYFTRPASAPVTQTTHQQNAAETGTGSTPSPTTTGNVKVAVSITNFAFSPSTITVHKGDTVVWTNNDSAPHTVTGDNGGPASGTLSQGSGYSYTFNTVGTFPYHCTIHPNMHGTVVVTN